MTAYYEDKYEFFNKQMEMTNNTLYTSKTSLLSEVTKQMLWIFTTYKVYRLHVSAKYMGARDFIDLCNN